ncbi:hypothetical protein LCGC14_1568300, partial [marine sediment metagenome]
MIEEDLEDIKRMQLILSEKLDKLIPTVEDMSEHLQAVKGIISDTTFPRRQPGKKKEVPMCGNCEGKNKVDYINKYCFRYGLCEECYKKPDSELRFPKEHYEPRKQPKKKVTILDNNP